MIRLSGTVNRLNRYQLWLAMLVVALFALQSPVFSMSPSLIGQTVEISYDAEPIFGHGHFQLTNPDDEAITFEVKQLQLCVAAACEPLQPTTIWDRERATDLDPTNFQVQADSTLDFYVSFPQAVRSFNAGEQVSVVLTLETGGELLEAASLFDTVRRLR